MKKITLLFIFCLTIVSWSYSQCTNQVYQFPSSTVTITDAPGLQTIATNNWAQNEYSVLEGLVSGNSYTVTTDIMTYITVTEANGTTIINSGFDSVSFTATTTGIIIYWTLDAACNDGPNTNILTQIECTTCTCAETAAPACTTEIAPLNNATGVATTENVSGTGVVSRAVAFEWNAIAGADTYEITLDGTIIGQTPNTAVNITGLDYGTTYTWSVAPVNCFGAATGCPTWTLTTEACTATAVPSCVTEISPANNDAAATTGPDSSVTFTWNEDPNADSYVLFINGFSQGVRDSGITFTGLGYSTAYTWSVVPSNCLGTATGCPEWSFTTQACNETAAPAVAASAPTPADGATAVAIQSPDGSFNFSWTDSGDMNESYTLNIGTTFPPDNAIPNFENGDALINLNVSTTYFWSIDVNNCFGTTEGPIWTFTTDAVLGIEDNTIETFRVYPNPTSDVLNIAANSTIDNVTVFNLLGQNVASFSKTEVTNSSIDMSGLSQGLYLVKITSGDKTQILRVTKK